MRPPPGGRFTCACAHAATTPRHVAAHRWAPAPLGFTNAQPHYGLGLKPPRPRAKSSCSARASQARPMRLAARSIGHPRHTACIEWPPARDRLRLHARGLLLRCRAVLPGHSERPPRLGAGPPRGRDGRPGKRRPGGRRRCPELPCSGRPGLHGPHAGARSFRGRLGPYALPLFLGLMLQRARSCRSWDWDFVVPMGHRRERAKKDHAPARAGLFQEALCASVDHGWPGAQRVAPATPVNSKPDPRETRPAAAGRAPSGDQKSQPGGAQRATGDRPPSSMSPHRDPCRMNSRGAGPHGPHGEEHIPIYMPILRPLRCCDSVRQHPAAPREMAC